MGLQTFLKMEGVRVFATADGTLLELYKKSAIPAFGYNDSVAFGFRVDDIEAASEELKKAGCELLGEINRVPD
jgi:predicted enzyme related to lactoylglutathione lyase